MEELKNLLPISPKLTDQIKNYLFPIEIEGKHGTCFFIKILYPVYTIYLCTSYDIISDDFVKSKGEIKINENIKIKLDENRQIIPFERKCKFILIRYGELCDENENILIFEQNLSVNAYIQKDAYLFGCYESNFPNGVGQIQAKILNIDGYKIQHQFDTKNLLFVSPICIINNNQFKIIGIQLEFPNLQEFKYMSYGYLLRYILKEININYEVKYIEHYLNTNDERIKFLDEFNKSAKYSFYTFDQYKNGIFYFHRQLAKYYNNQTLQNFNNNYNIISQQNFYKKYHKYFKNLHFFKNITNNQFRIFNDLELVNNFNEILTSGDYDLIEKFSYFIAGFIYVLNTYSREHTCQFVNDGDQLYMRTKLSLDDLNELDSNVNNVITFKKFLIDVTSLEHLNGKINAFVINLNNFFNRSNTDKYDTKIYILHNYYFSWRASCFSTMPVNNKIFNLFSFFKVNEVKINYETKYAEIRLELVGKKKIFEQTIGNNENAKFNIYYDKNQNYVEIIEEE